MLTLNFYTPKKPDSKRHPVKAIALHILAPGKLWADFVKCPAPWYESSEGQQSKRESARGSYARQSRHTATIIQLSQTFWQSPRRA